MKSWNSDKVGFVVFRNSEKGMTDLLDVDGTGEGGFLGVVAFELVDEGLVGFGGVEEEGGTLIPCLSFHMQ